MSARLEEMLKEIEVIAASKPDRWIQLNPKYALEIVAAVRGSLPLGAPQESGEPLPPLDVSDKTVSDFGHAYYQKHTAWGYEQIVASIEAEKFNNTPIWKQFLFMCSLEQRERQLLSTLAILRHRDAEVEMLREERKHSIIATDALQEALLDAQASLATANARARTAKADTLARCLQVVRGVKSPMSTSPYVKAILALGKGE